MPAGGALTGWSLGVKDIIDVEGMPTRWGADGIPAKAASVDATCVALLRAAGAVPLGKTVTTEFAYVTPGPTRNPANVSHTPGGSSSGSAAAVAAGHVRLALGTQTGGSMIRPAAFCGVVGVKPTFGAVARAGMVVACESLDVIGWYATSVSDAAAAAYVLLPGNASAAGPVSECRVAILPGHPGHLINKEADDALIDAGCRLIAAGAHEVPCEADAMPVQTLLKTHHTLMHYEFARSLLPVVARHRNALSSRLLQAVDVGMRMSGNSWLEAHARQEHLRGQWDHWFGKADLILTSSALGTAPAGLAHTGDSGFNKGWSVLGWPCIHLPTTHARNGLPLGVLLVGRPHSDAALLAWASVLHPLIDRRITRPPYGAAPTLEHPV